MTEFYLAPLRGITDRVFRAAYERRFGRFDRIVAPFVPTVPGNRVRDHHIRDLLPSGGACINNIDHVNNTGGIDDHLIPQIIGRDSKGFLLLARRFADTGFASVNWNLGCPAPLVAKKGRGCGLLPHKDAVKRFLDETIPGLPIPLSIKARLGYESPDELEALIPLFNGYPIKELMIHPRTGAQLYGGAVDIDRFEACLNLSKHEVVYNGDIVDVDSFRRLADRFPGVNKWMIGRGAVRNPFLLRELRGAGSIEESLSTEDLSQIIGFLNELLDACKDHPNQLKVLGRMKEIWRYLGGGVDGWGELSKKVILCRSLREYKMILLAI